jgi:hypothetical protein
MASGLRCKECYWQQRLGPDKAIKLLGHETIVWAERLLRILEALSNYHSQSVYPSVNGFVRATREQQIELEKT